jgi:hypothetical protein
MQIHAVLVLDSAGPVTGPAPIRWLASMLSTQRVRINGYKKWGSECKVRKHDNEQRLAVARSILGHHDVPPPCPTSVPLTTTVHRANSADTVSKRRIARQRARYACCALDSSAERPRRHVPGLLLAHCLACTVYQARYTCPLAVSPVYLSGVHPCHAPSPLSTCLSVYPLRLFPQKTRVPCSHIGPGDLLNPTCIMGTNQPYLYPGSY